MRRLILTAVFVLAVTTPALAAQRPGDNPQMSAIFDADQALRQGFSTGQTPDRAFVERMAQEDAERRGQVRALLSAGALSTAEDYRKAAFIFQHGAEPSDYLLAHSLAVAAAVRGSDEAGWIAAASLDRYLQMKGEPQIYGTQTIARSGQDPTLEPYDRVLVPDSLRTVLGVPTQVEQDQRLEAVKAAVQARRANP